MGCLFGRRLLLHKNSLLSKGRKFGEYFIHDNGRSKKTAQQIVKELESGKWMPFYLVVGNEPFQAREIQGRLKQFFIKDEAEGAFNLEVFDGEQVDGGSLLGALQTLPGLFSVGETNRLVICNRFDKVGAATLALLQDYFKDPSPSTSFLMVCDKVDKRKAWFKAMTEKAYVVEVSEPYDRDWPKWWNFFERKIGKKIEGEAWQTLLENSNRTLSVLWSELQKLATYAGERSEISLEDLNAFAMFAQGRDVFGFAEDVLFKRSYSSVKKFRDLVRSGENEVKILSILIRQFRLVERCIQLQKEGIRDRKIVASQLGVHPFFVSKIMKQAESHSAKSTRQALSMLSECDYLLKTGAGGLFEHFLMPYFQSL